MGALLWPIEFTPVDLNLNARAFSAGINSNGFGCEAYNQLTLEVFIDYTAATDLTFYIESSNDKGTTWNRFRVGDLDPSTGVETMRERQFNIPVSAADTRATINIPINHTMLRLASVDGTAATDDTVTVLARLGCV